MNFTRKFGAALGVFAVLTLAVPTLAAPKPRRDPAAQAALTTIAQMQNTLIAMQKLIDGIQARNTAGAAPAPAPAPAGQ